MGDTERIAALADKARQTSMGWLLFEREFRCMVLARIAPEDAEAIAQGIIEADDGGRGAAQAELDDMTEEEREEVQSQAVRRVFDLCAESARVTMGAARSLEIGDDISPDAVAFYAASVQIWPQDRV